jgi:hypothetical protein
MMVRFARRGDRAAGKENRAVPQSLEFAVRALSIGAGATVLLDLWAQFATRAFGMPAANWALVGRWIGHFPRGRFVHDNIAKASPVAGERALGWVAHYAIGVLYAALLVAISGLDWARHPTPLPALAVGLVTVAAPLFVMQPGMGLGIAASKTPNPNAARLRSIATHGVFGLGLYVSALVVAPLI